MRAFSEIMCALRREKGLTQRAAAAELQLSQALLSHYENGAREPGLDFLRRACRFYGVSADYLLGLRDSDARPERTVLEETLTGLDALRRRIGAALEETT